MGILDFLSLADDSQHPKKKSTHRPRGPRSHARPRRLSIQRLRPRSRTHHPHPLLLRRYRPRPAHQSCHHRRYFSGIFLLPANHRSVSQRRWFLHSGKRKSRQVAGLLAAAALMTIMFWSWQWVFPQGWERLFLQCPFFSRTH